jgi:hypothetical protein
VTRATRGGRVAGVVAVIVVLFTAASVRAQSSDPWMGTWKLNVAKSTYQPGPPPQSSVIRHEPWDGGLKVTSDTADARGRVGHTEWTGKYDGRSYPIRGNTQTNTRPPTRSITRLDSRTYVTVNKSADGQRTIRNRWVVSRDGKIMTQSQTGKNVQGQAVKNTAVWEKQ